MTSKASVNTVVRRRLSWLQSGLFWRTFFLLAFLLAASMAAWVASFRIVERTPRGEQIAAQVVSIVTITRAALTHSAPALRRELLFDLASTQGIRVYTREDDDQTNPLPDNAVNQVIESTVRARLGKETQFAGFVNGLRGFWISFRIEDDDYWLMLD
ncbi:MAG: two-component sensor histidine kinase, partial [Burkholderiaceae bacterium]